jgi:hypothetical protein
MPDTAELLAIWAGNPALIFENVGAACGSRTHDLRITRAAHTTPSLATLRLCYSTGRLATHQLPHWTPVRVTNPCHDDVSDEAAGTGRVGHAMPGVILLGSGDGNTCAHLLLTRCDRNRCLTRWPHVFRNGRLCGTFNWTVLRDNRAGTEGARAGKCTSLAVMPLRVRLAACAQPRRRRVAP